MRIYLDDTAPWGLFDSWATLAHDPAEADALWVGLRTRYDWFYLSGFPNLRVIATPTTGTDHIDLETCLERGITVLSLQGERAFLDGIHATAEHTWALILALTRRIPWAHQDVVNGYWNRSNFIGNELHGKTLGIVGYGRVGSQVAIISRGFGMEKDYFEWYDWEDPDYFEFWLKDKDIVTIHLPLDASTRNLIDASRFDAMKPGAYFINTSRGAIVDEAALLAHLESGHLAGAALDVVCGEPDPPKALIAYARAHGNLLLTPHIGGATHESMAATRAFMADKLRKWWEGQT